MALVGPQHYGGWNSRVRILFLNNRRQSGVFIFLFSLPLNIVPCTLNLLFNLNFICYPHLCSILTNVFSEVRCTLT